jgi:alpha-N-arabinofuranosidase
MQWRTDLIGYDTLTSYGSPAYYAQKMFNLNHGDTVLATASENIPTREWQPPAGRGGGAPPGPRQVPTLFFNATRDSKNGTIYLKVVNSAGTPQSIQVETSGLSSIESKGQTVAMSASSPDDTNSITEPAKIVPVTTKVEGLSKNFKYTFPAYSITILQMKGK